MQITIVTLISYYHQIGKSKIVRKKKDHKWTAFFSDTLVNKILNDEMQ